ncbi:MULTISPECIES: N-acetylneuraminate synthase [Rummeliibacillus]|uniref:N-acetylneuraminate synthase n=1 Tax=Rummeliibacillus TaxID=648802 RepID=UPI0011B50DB3|nr:MULTISPECIES: N-acetylneuraminate synthase [Rummeliibacillus]
MNRTYIIAEAGVNHNGSLELALKLVEEAAKAGADAVKFQTFITENTISKNAAKAEYQKKTTDQKESQLEMVKKLELTYEDFKVIQKHCEKNKITFLSTGFDIDSIEFLDKTLNVPYIKLPSGDVNNAPLVLKAAQTGKDIFLSTGMCTLEDIHNALAIIYYGYTRKNTIPKDFEEVIKIYQTEDISILKEKVTILQCTTEYPTPVEDINLKTLLTLAKEFHTKVGLSDHSQSPLTGSLAVALGATVIEKHFTLDKTMEGPDHQASLEPFELKEMIDNIRFTERALGQSNKVIADSEKKNILIARKSIVANKIIKKGEYFTPENLIIKRPATGINPLFYWDYLGKKALNDYKEDEIIKNEK